MPVGVWYCVEVAGEDDGDVVYVIESLLVKFCDVWEVVHAVPVGHGVDLLCV